MIQWKSGCLLSPWVCMWHCSLFVCVCLRGMFLCVRQTWLHALGQLRDAHFCWALRHAAPRLSWTLKRQNTHTLTQSPAWPLTWSPQKSDIISFSFSHTVVFTQTSCHNHFILCAYRNGNLEMNIHSSWQNPRPESPNILLQINTKITCSVKEHTCYSGKIIFYHSSVFPTKLLTK